MNYFTHVETPDTYISYILMLYNDNSYIDLTEFNCYL